MTGNNDSIPNVSRETLGRLTTYETLLKKWNPAINLVSKSSLAEMSTRHFADSAQLFKLMPRDSKVWMDIGSGGGFPGLVCAIMAAELSPYTEFHLVESDMRKATFLRNVAREVNVPVSVHSERIEKMIPICANVLSARALASLDKLLEFSKLHLDKDGIALFPKGENYKLELDQARKSWNFECEEHESTTDPKSVVLGIRNIERA
jgi:16S rRNA (guanine527-N7)-methyltransferase